MLLKHSGFSLISFLMILLALTTVATQLLLTSRLDYLTVRFQWQQHAAYERLQVQWQDLKTEFFNNLAKTVALEACTEDCEYQLQNYHCGVDAEHPELCIAVVRFDLSQAINANTVLYFTAFEAVPALIFAANHQMIARLLAVKSVAEILAVQARKELYGAYGSWYRVGSAIPNS